MNIVPYPRMIIFPDKERGERTVDLCGFDRVIFASSDADTAAVGNRVEQLFGADDGADDIIRETADDGRCAVVFVSKDHAAEHADDISGTISGLIDEAGAGEGDKHAQGYVLSISERAIVVRANDPDGVFYGLTTLLQISESEGHENIPVCVIDDWPQIQVRGHFDDISRKRISTLDDFRMIIRELGMYKINYYGMYLEDVLHLKSFPDIGRGRGKLMPREVEEIIEEGRLNNVEIVPFFQLLGHCENMLGSKNYEQLGRSVKQQLSTLDPDNPEVRRFLEICIREVCDMFPCGYFGMGCDETQGVDAGTYIDHLNFCAGELEKHGKTPVFWADMFYNHFGYERLSELNPSIIPVNWQYDTEEDGTVAYQDYLEKSGKNIWGFGGYSSWCTYIPDFTKVKHHMDVWAENMAKRENAALWYSQWGDDGYENNRDIVWMLTAYSGETSWLGGRAEEITDVKEGFDQRFQTIFFGKNLPALTRFYNDLSDDQKVPSNIYWKLHRKNACGAVRIAEAVLNGNVSEDGTGYARDDYRHDSGLFEEMYNDILIEFDNVADDITEHGRLTYCHILTCLELAKLNADKMVLAFDICGEMNSGHVPDKWYNRVCDFVWQVRNAGEEYINDWLLNNRREGLQVSSKVFDDTAASFEELIGDEDYKPLHYMPLDLSESYNCDFEGVCGIPIGYSRVEGVPFLFADKDHTHIRISKAGEKVVAQCRRTAPYSTVGDDTHIRDLHLIISAPMDPDLDDREIVRVTAEDVYGQRKTAGLRLTRHLCDWWAPAGDHIWAGGGYAYTDKERVSLSISNDRYYGLCTVSGFEEFAGMDIPTRFEIELLENYEVNVFAAAFSTWKG